MKVLGVNFFLKHSVMSKVMTVTVWAHCVALYVYGMSG